jgi:hypothetical protein
VGGHDDCLAHSPAAKLAIIWPVLLLLLLLLLLPPWIDASTLLDAAKGVGGCC